MNRTIQPYYYKPYHEMSAVFDERVTQVEKVNLDKTQFFSLRNGIYNDMVDFSNKIYIPLLTPYGYILKICPIKYIKTYAKRCGLSEQQVIENFRLNSLKFLACIKVRHNGKGIRVAIPQPNRKDIILISRQKNKTKYSKLFPFDRNKALNSIINVLNFLEQNNDLILPIIKHPTDFLQ